jgi:integrase
MPRKSEALLSTDREVSAVKPPQTGRAEYRIAGTPGLVLRVTPDGRRSWVVWLKPEKTGKWRKLTIGAYPGITLARARQESLRLRTAVLDGGNPFDTRAAGRGAPSVRTLGETFIKRYARPNKRSWAEDARKLEREIYPVLGGHRADLVTKSDIVRLLDAIHDRGAPVQANRMLSLLRKLFNWAAAEGYLESPNPAAGLPMRAKENVRRRVLTEEELHTFWHAIDNGVGFEDITADALRLQLLLGARVREVTGMARCELALEQEIPLWVLPAARAKSGRDVPRPLPPMALAIIRRRLSAIGDNPFVFISPIDPSQPIIAQAPSQAIRRAAQRGLVPSEFTPHDLRRTARTFWAKLGVMPEIARRILGHAPPRSDVDAIVYDQHLYLDEMLQALRQWEARLVSIVSRPASSPMDVEVAA